MLDVLAVNISNDTLVTILAVLGIIVLALWIIGWLIGRWPWKGP